MEKKLAETEIERESKEAELRDLRQKIMFMGVTSNNQVQNPGSVGGVAQYGLPQGYSQQPHPSTGGIRAGGASMQGYHPQHQIPSVMSNHNMMQQ